MNAELKKQIGDQSLHLIVGIVLVNIMALIFPIWLAALLMAVAWGIREWEQWPSARWYDPYLDWFFQAGGIGLGIWWYL